ncbi:MAG: hypothetical protein JO227_04520 [Acetobacteraceae bacterium]|nr:hypothetical protein [Acetobacteraceae bacterium]
MAAEVDTIEVPAFAEDLIPLPPSRVRKLRKHLLESLRALRTMKDPDGSASPIRPEPEGFTGKVARTACALCAGWCCKGGEEHAYLDERTLARVRRDQPDLDARGVIRLYINSVALMGYSKSCIFHGPSGCTLDRRLRSDVCNSYFCGELARFVNSDPEPGPVVVIAAKGRTKRRSRRVKPI